MGKRRSGDGRSARARQGALLTVILTLAVVVALSVLPPTTGVPGASDSGLRPAASIPPWNNWTCNPNNPSPAALYIPQVNIAAAETAGSNLTVTLEFGVVNYTQANNGTTIFLPTSKAVLPLSPSGSVSLTLPNRPLTVDGANWSAPSLLNVTVTLPVPYNFSASAAYLSTSKSAVMANATSGSLTLEFRWRWTISPAGGGVPTIGPWSVPDSNATSPDLPSVFFPAPWIGVTATSPIPAPGNSVFDLTLVGAVANTSFRVVLEYPNNGTEIQSVWENTSATGTTFVAHVPLAHPSGVAVAPGTYIVHVHDVCEAIVHIESITVDQALGTGGAPAPPPYLLYGIIIVVVAAAVGVVGVWVVRRSRAKPPAAESATPTSPPPPPS